jgi:hypothetical protein
LLRLQPELFLLTFFFRVPTPFPPPAYVPTPRQSLYFVRLLQPTIWLFPFPTLVLIQADVVSVALFIRVLFSAQLPALLLF